MTVWRSAHKAAFSLNDAALNQFGKRLPRPFALENLVRQQKVRGRQSLMRHFFPSPTLSFNPLPLNFFFWIPGEIGFFVARPVPHLLRDSFAFGQSFVAPSLGVSIGAHAARSRQAVWQRVVDPKRRVREVLGASRACLHVAIILHPKYLSIPRLICGGAALAPSPTRPPSPTQAQAPVSSSASRPCPSATGPIAPQ